MSLAGFSINTGGSLVRSGVWRYCGRSATVAKPGGWTLRSLTKMSAAVGVLGNDPVFAQTMLRIKDPEKSRVFYEKLLGMTFLTRLDFPSLEFSLYFYAYADGEQVPDLETPQAERAQWLWGRRYHTVELTHNWGTEKDENFAHHSGNADPVGYAFSTIWVDDVSEVHKKLVENGVGIVRGPEPMNPELGTQMLRVYDPDGYWVLFAENSMKKRSTNSVGVLGPSPTQRSTEFRVKDAQKSIKFYEDLGLTLMAQHEIKESGAELTIYGMGYPRSTVKSLDASASMSKSHIYLENLENYVLFLHHYHGSENDEKLTYHNGNTDPKGFGHIGFIVTDVEKAVEEAEKKGIAIKRKAGPFQDAGVIAFILDPDGYWIELIQRNGSEQKDASTANRK